MLLNRSHRPTITPGVDAALLRAAAAIGGAGVVPLLLGGVVAANGCGYQITFVSSGNDTGITFTVTGVRVGDLTGTTTEVVTGASGAAANTTNYFARVTSVVASGAAAGTVSIGTVGSLALRRARLKTVYFVGVAGAGAITLRVSTTTGPVVLRLGTPAGSAADAFTVPLDLAPQPTPTPTIVVLTAVTDVTFICG